MTLIAPGVARFTVHGLYGSRPVANVLDMQVDTTGSAGSRTDGLFEIAGDIINNWSDHILPNVVDQYSATSVTWVDLDTSSGPTGERVQTSAQTWPKAGVGSGSEMPGNVAALVKKNITGTRGRRSGRMYLCGVPEGWTPSNTPNNIDPTVIAVLNTSFASFLSGINDAEGPWLDMQRQLVVVHTRLGSDGVTPIYNGYTPVSSLTVESRLATQRRRLRG